MVQYLGLRQDVWLSNIFTARASDYYHASKNHMKSVLLAKDSSDSSKWSRLTRRQYLSKTSLAMGAVTFSFPYVGRVLGANDRINVACIGVGGKGDSDSSDASGCGGNIVALCDADTDALDAKSKT